jgi:hypothetical protein
MRIAIYDYFDDILSVHGKDYPHPDLNFKVRSRGEATIFSRRSDSGEWLQGG